jgi:membrane fusion protein, heavy metal efflux system
MANAESPARLLPLLAVLLALAACREAPAAKDAHAGHDDHGDEVHLSAEARKLAGIRTEAARKVVLRPVLRSPARVSLDGDSMAHVGAPFAGRVRNLRVRRGDTVAKGDLLLEVESPEFAAAQILFLERRDALALAGPPVELARKQAERARAAFDSSRGVTLSVVEDRERAALEAESARAAALAAATAAENHLHVFGLAQEEVDALAESREIRRSMGIRAPLPGEVIEREVTLGESVVPEREALLVIAGTESLWVLADVPETRIGRVERGGPASVTTPAFPGRVFAGTVGWIAPRVEEESRTVKVRVGLQRGDSGLLPGMFAEVDLPEAGPPPPAVVAVPSGAVHTVEGGPGLFVPVEGEADTFALRKVRVGAPVGGMVPVLEGLAEGEEFVADGGFVLKAELGKSSAAHEH